MKKTIMFIICMFLFSAFLNFFFVEAVSADNSNITFYVGGSGLGNYSIIQDAIDNASDGDTVFVYSGTYIENVVVNKSIKIIGEDRNLTIIDGGCKGVVLYIAAEDTVLTGFTIQNGRLGYGGSFVISLNSNFSNISYNNIQVGAGGISLYNSSFNVLFENYIFASITGMSLDNSHNNTISKNIINKGGTSAGISFCGSNNNTIAFNQISNTHEGIFIGGSDEDSCFNNFYNNIIFNNSYGLDFRNGSNNIFSSNYIVSNHAEGISLGCYFYAGNKNEIFCNSNNNLLYNNYISNLINIDDWAVSENIWNITKTSGTNIIGGPYLGGNYWSDYNENDTNGDGIGDTNLPYWPGDNLPLIKFENELKYANFSYSQNYNILDFIDKSLNNMDIINWYWTFGDGSASYEQNPIHTYDLSGEYNVTLTIIYNNGTIGSFTKQITTFIDEKLEKNNDMLILGSIIFLLIIATALYFYFKRRRDHT